jgi:hypothetical protein
MGRTMHEPLSGNIEVPSPRSEFQRRYDLEVEFAQSACFTALFLLAILATLVVVLTFLATSRIPPRSSELCTIFVSVLSIVEFGEIVFLSHVWYLLPRFPSARFLAVAGSISISAMQMAILSTLGGAETPRLLAFCIVALVIYFASLWMTGWFFHRLFGASLSFGGQDVFQEAIGTKVLLLLSPFLVALGLLPILGSMVLGDAMTVDSAVRIVFSSLTLIGVTAIPLATVYLLMAVVRMKGYARYVAVTAVMSIIGLAVMIDWTTKYWTWSILIGLVAAYVAGVGLGMAPFVWYGFRPVWAKRKRIEETERSVSFDDVI